MAAGIYCLIILVLGIQMLLLPLTMCAPAKGQLHWKKDDFQDNFLTGYFDDSLVLDCELSSPSVNVTFLVLQLDSSFTKIVIDGKKYQRIGSQKLKINNLNAEDAVSHLCRADGVRDKVMDLYIERKMQRADFSVSILGEHDKKEKCSRKTADERQIICKASGHGNLRLYRLRNTTDELITKGRTESGFEGGHSVQRLFYKINDATKKDEGTYICYFDTADHGRLSSKKFNLIVDDSPPVIRSFPSKVAKEGDKVTLKCKPSIIWPPEEITYYVNGRPITDPRFNSRYKASCQKLRIDRVKYPDDDAVFTCKVHNKYGIDAKNATLRVFVKPEIDKSVSAIVEQDVPVICKLKRSNPPANIKWQVQPYCHNRIRECWHKESLWQDAEGSQFRIFSSKTYSKIYVPPQARGDYFFRCVANNSVGADRHIFKFLYIREVDSPLVIVNKSMEVNERETILITCKSKPRLFSKLSWRKDGRNVSEGVISVPDSQSSYVTSSVLKIGSAALSDAGNYTCFGHEWRGGVVTTHATIKVKKIFPPIVDLQGQPNVPEGNAVILHCDVKSNPTSLIVWHKDGVEIKVEDRNFFRGADQCQSSKNGYYFKLENGERKFSHLIICDSNLAINNGTYTCKAENSLGSANSSAALNILKRPFLELKASVSVRVGESVNEICKAIGNPRPKVYWRQKASGERMSAERDSSSRLVIPRVSEKDFISYECFAWNALGNASATMEIQNMNDPVLARTISARTDQTNSSRLYILLAASFLGVIIVLSAGFVLLRRRKIYGGFYLFSQPPDPDYFRNIDPSRALIEQTNGLPYDPVWEFPRKRIRLLDRLGSGAFGDVHLAEAVGIVCFDPREKICMKHKPLVGRRRSRSGSTSSRTGSSYRRLVTKVAVKKLKENATQEEMRDLVSELKILIHIGEHSNIVNLLGACTRGGDKELMVILEYAPHGNLLSFLKNRRQMLKTTWKKEAIGMEDELTTCDLAVIAYQVAKGMEFLASRRCVHRDLAARNVLVGEGYIMKIADFGLARDIYKDDRYVKLSAGLLPIKWMAIEAIKERIFTNQSDVWSYGILLWEIMTMGGSPYPGLPVRDLLEALISGYRMDKPIYCPDEIYYLMGDCWIEDPNDRPTFVEIVNRCARIIEARLTPEESCNFLDPEHFTGDGYLRPIESPRSPIASLISPPPPYSAYINQKENRFFGSDISIQEENSCKKVDYPDVVLLETKRLNSVSEIKAKRDAAQKEKKDSLSSSLPENEVEGESDSTEATAPSPLLNGRVGYAKGSDKINFYDCEKDFDETEQRRMLLDEHSYINHSGHNFGNQYLNA